MIDIAKTFADLRVNINAAIDQYPTTPSTKREIELLTKIGFAALTIAECALTDLRRLADAAELRKDELLP